jgi:hypothetical protein
MASTLSLMAGLHIGLSREHFFQLAVDPLVLQALINAVLKPHTEVIAFTLLPIEVEEGDLLIQRDGADSAVAISRQHRQRLRRDPTAHLTSLTSIHFRPPSSIWNAVEGNGYCGYETIREMLAPGAPSFRLVDPELRTIMRLFLRQLLLWIPADMSRDVKQRVRAAISCLDSSSVLPRRAWCHMDLVTYFAVREKGHLAVLPYTRRNGLVNTVHKWASPD